MKRYIVSEITRHGMKIIISFPFRGNDISKPFVAEINGNLYLINPESSTKSEDGKYIFIQAQKPDRPMNYAEIVGWTIRSARIEAGLSCKEVADRVGIKTLTIEKIELGRFTMNVLLLGRLAEAIGMEVSLTPKKTIHFQANLKTH